MKIKNIERRFLMQFISVIVGLILWVVLVYIEDASFETTLKDIPIQLNGETALLNNDLLVVNKSSVGESAISVRGKRSDIINSMDDISATIDVSKITVPGVYNIKVDYELATNAIYITEKKTSSVEISVERMQSRDFDVKVIQQGVAVPDKLIESQITQDKISVKGSSGDISMIDHLAVFVDISTITHETVSRYALKAVDKDDKEIKFTDEIYMASDGIDVTNVAHKKIKVPVKADLRDPDKKCVLKLESISESEVYIGVDSDISVTELKAIVNYDEKNTEYTVELEDVDGVYIPPESRTVTVKIKADLIEEQYISVPLNVKKADGQQYNAPSEVTLRVRGAASDIIASNITAEIDITGHGTGFFSAEVNVTFKEATLSLAEKQFITVNIE